MPDIKAIEGKRKILFLMVTNIFKENGAYNKH